MKKVTPLALACFNEQLKNFIQIIQHKSQTGIFIKLL